MLVASQDHHRLDKAHLLIAFERRIDDQSAAAVHDLFGLVQETTESFHVHSLHTHSNKTTIRHCYRLSRVEAGFGRPKTMLV